MLLAGTIVLYVLDSFLFSEVESEKKKLANEQGKRSEGQWSVSRDVWQWLPRRVFSTVAPLNQHHALTSISWNLIYPASLKSQSRPIACEERRTRFTKARNEFFEYQEALTVKHCYRSRDNIVMPLNVMPDN